MLESDWDGLSRPFSTAIPNSSGYDGKISLYDNILYDVASSYYIPYLQLQLYVSL